MLFCLETKMLNLFFVTLEYLHFVCLSEYSLSSSVQRYITNVDIVYIATNSSIFNKGHLTYLRNVQSTFSWMKNKTSRLIFKILFCILYTFKSIIWLSHSSLNLIARFSVLKWVSHLSQLLFHRWDIWNLRKCTPITCQVCIDMTN